MRNNNHLMSILCIILDYIRHCNTHAVDHIHYDLSMYKTNSIESMWRNINTERKWVEITYE